MSVEAVETVPAARARRLHPTRWILPAYAWLMIAYTVVPIAVIVIYGFNQAPSGRLTFSWIGATTYWYRHVFDISDLTGALWNSLELAGGSTAIALLLGVPLALALARHRFWGRGATDAVIFVDIAAPSVVVGASLLSFFITLNVARGMGTILIAHVAFNIAYVAIIVRARAVGLDPSIEKAAYDLGAGPWTTWS